MVVVRNAVMEDAERILEIYDYYVKNTAITFEYDTPSLNEFKERMEKTMQRYPYLVILKNGQIEGYAYAGAFVGRAAYDWSCEMTVYLDHNAQKCGMGRIIYQALEKALYDMGILNLYACIGYPENEDEYLTTNSADFHVCIFADIGNHIHRRFRGNHLPCICVHCHCFCAFRPGCSHNHSRNNGGNRKENIKQRRMEQTVKINAQHTFYPLEKAGGFKLQFVYCFHFYSASFFDISST